MAYNPLRPNQLFDQPLFTYKDAVDHLLQWNGGNPDPIARQDARRACSEALREVANCHRWSFYYGHGRVTTVASYETGTVAYDHTGGANERQLTLSGGTWPEWAAYGTVQISSVPYVVAKRVSDTILQLAEESNPGADVSSGTEYQIYRESYPLPPLWKHLCSPLVDATQARVLRFVDPKVWLNDQRWSRSPSQPFGFTIMGSRQLHGQNAIWMSPPPEAARTYDCVYLRAARPLVTEEYATGTVSCSSGSATLTGSGTAWTSAHKGAVVRLSPTSSAVTNAYGSNPPAQERVIIEVASATSITVDSAFDQTLSAVKYVISDPVDVDLQSMLNLFLRLAEKRMGSFRHRTDMPELERIAIQEQMLAMAADNRWLSTRVAGLMTELGWTESVLHTATLGSSVP